MVTFIFSDEFNESTNDIDEETCISHVEDFYRIVSNDDVNKYLPISGYFNGSIIVEEKYEDVSNDDGINNDEDFPSGEFKGNDDDD
jgi:hypothetical protein